MAKGKKKDADETIEFELEYEKETKRTVKYSDGSETRFKNIYFTQKEIKEVFGEYPKKLSVVVTRAK